MSEHHDHSHAVVTEENSKKLMVALGLTTTFNSRSCRCFYYPKFGFVI